MRLCKVRLSSGEVRAGIFEEDRVLLFNTSSLANVIYAEDPPGMVRGFVASHFLELPIEKVLLLPPIDNQEVWAAGVTYKRSREARERESTGAASFYDLVYSAPRPELFFKATHNRVVGPGGPVRVRSDSRWSVPEPELALVLSPSLKLVGFTIGNDMSARDIEGENPLYLPQAKVYDHCCALGPAITLADDMPKPEDTTIRLIIRREGKDVFDDSTSFARMIRPFDDLTQWLGRDNSFPNGVILLTGTGIVPPDDFSLKSGDLVTIDISGIGQLSNVVEQFV